MSKITNLIGSIVVERLIADGYDGLHDPSHSCCCTIKDGDCPCDDVNLSRNCKAGHFYKKEIVIETIVADMVPAIGIEAPWVLVPKKEDGDA